MATFRCEISDPGNLSGRLDELQRFEVTTALTATVNEMAANLRSSTPRQTGSLVNSMRQEVTGVTGRVGYLQDYAPHVEYGHRQAPGRYVPKLGKQLKASYVEGQHFLQAAVEAERPKFRRRLQELMRE